MLLVAAIAAHFLLLHALGMKEKPVVQFDCLHGKSYLEYVSSTQLFAGTSVFLNHIYRVKQCVGHMPFQSSSSAATVMK